jgi:hypothetical protein
MKCNLGVYTPTVPADSVVMLEKSNPGIYFHLQSRHSRR